MEVFDSCNEKKIFESNLLCIGHSFKNARENVGEIAY